MKEEFTNQSYPKAEQIAKSKLQALADFIQQCSDCPVTKNTAISAMVFGLWQMTSRGTMPPAPSAVLVDHQPDSTNSIDQLMNELIAPRSTAADKRTGKGSFLGGTKEQAPTMMMIYYKKR